MTPETGVKLPSADNLDGILLRGIQEILGKEQAASLMQKTSWDGSDENYPELISELKFFGPASSGILKVIETEYGEQAGRGVALRIGQACFKYALRTLGPAAGITELDFRLLPLPRKVQEATQAVAKQINNQAGLHLALEITDKGWLWHLQGCPICLNRQTTSPACYWVVGLLQEALYWLSGGKQYLVEEIACIAAGEAQCTFRAVTLAKSS